LDIEHGNGKSSLTGGVDGKIIYKWMIAIAMFDYQRIPKFCACCPNDTFPH
jgi:hypothetical protein